MEEPFREVLAGPDRLRCLVPRANAVRDLVVALLLLRPWSSPEHH